MKKTVRIIAICILCFFVDNVFTIFLPLKSFLPSFLLVFVLSVSIIKGNWDALWLGVFSGILQDLFFYKVFGINSLLNMLLCVLAALIGKNIYKEKKVVPVLSCFVLTAIKGLGIFVILYCLGQKVDIMLSLYTGISNMVVCFIFYRSIYRLCEKQFSRREWKF